MERSLIIEIASSETLAAREKLEIVQGNLSDEEIFGQLLEVYLDLEIEEGGKYKDLYEKMSNITFSSLSKMTDILYRRLQATETKKQAEVENFMTADEMKRIKKFMKSNGIREIKKTTLDNVIYFIVAETLGEPQDSAVVEYIARGIKAAQRRMRA